MPNRIIRILFVLYIVILLTGCDSGSGVPTTKMDITDIGIISISDERPADVVIRVTGWYKNTCVSQPKVYYDRNGNTIQVSAKYKAGGSSSGFCGQAITEVYGDVTIRKLEVGKYKIITHDTEQMQLHIEEDTAYVVTKGTLADIDIITKTLSEDELTEIPDDFSDPVQVILKVTFQSRFACEPDHNIQTEQDELGVINVDIMQVVPIDGTCEQVLYPYPFSENYIPLYTTELTLGTYPRGVYKVNINDWYFTITI